MPVQDVQVQDVQAQDEGYSDSKKCIICLCRASVAGVRWVSDGENLVFIYLDRREKIEDLNF